MGQNSKEMYEVPDPTFLWQSYIKLFLIFITNCLAHKKHSINSNCLLLMPLLLTNCIYVCQWLAQDSFDG